MSRSGRRVYRTNDARWVIAFYTAMACGWVVAALFPSAAQGFCIGCAAFFGIWAIWVWQYGVHVTGEGVRVVTILRSMRVPWSEIARFELVARDSRKYFAVVKRGERTMVMSSALCTPVRPEAKVERYRRDIEAVIDDLNKLLAERSPSINLGSELASS